MSLATRYNGAAVYQPSLKINGLTGKPMNNDMKTIKLIPLLAAGLLVAIMTSCGPGYVNTGVGYGGYGARPYYGNGYSPYGYYRPPVVVRRPPVVIRQRYYAPAPRYNGGSARRGYGGGGYNNGGGRSRGPR
jgi:hypothetical protein